jgi:hypothetical protein
VFYDKKEKNKSKYPGTAYLYSYKTKTIMPELILATNQGSLGHFIVTTVPLFGLFVYFLYEAYRRPNEAIYQLGDDYNDDQWQAANEATGALMPLKGVVVVFLSFHVLWTIFAIYVVTFVPKRRHLIGRYLSDGEECLGDIIYDKNSRRCSSFHEYGYAVYPHPTQKSLIRKRVRVYQPYTRERIAILRLPNKPLSGQAKIDVEIDLRAASKDRDKRNKWIAFFSTFWFFFTLLGAAYVIHQMSKVDDKNENAEAATRLFIIIVGANLPCSYFLNLMRYLMFRNWLTNRGAMIENVDDARNLQPGSLFDAESVDGSTNGIPYSIMNEEEMSYQGSLPSHNLCVVEMESVQEDKKVWVTL